MSNLATPALDCEDSRPRSGAWAPVMWLATLLAVVWLGVACSPDERPDDVRSPVAAPTVAGTNTRPNAPTPTAAAPSTQLAPAPHATAAPSANTPRETGPNVRAMPASIRGAAMTADDFPTPPDRDLLLLARQMRWKGLEPETTSTAQLTGLQVGDLRDFWTLDYPKRTMVRNEFRLAAISENAYWWAGASHDASDDEVARTVADAEEQVFPPLEAVFASGDEPERVHVINGRIPGVGGYVSGSDQYPSTVSPYSNELPAIYINTRAAAYGDERLLDILAHELQHVIHQVADDSEATWLNEGLSELAVTEAGYRAGSIFGYLRRPYASLVNWPADLSGSVGLNYGAAALFAHYMREHYAPAGGLQDLLAIDSDGIEAVDEFLALRGSAATVGGQANFHTVFADWMVANLLDEEAGRYGYGNLDVQASITKRQNADDDGPSQSLAQYAIDYVRLQDVDDGITVRFEGLGTTPLLPTEVDDKCWWSNRGDTISATLTRRLTVPAVSGNGAEPELTYRYWHDIEEEWDYLYVSASVDGGATWDVLQASGTTDANPVGNSYGYGYTGDSGGWQDGTASLADYAGREAMVRFHYVTDDAINGPGMCVQDPKISGRDNAADAGDWAPDGFVLVNNQVRQDWIVWVILDGSENPAHRMDLTWDAERDRLVGSLAVEVVSGDRLVIAVAPAAPATMQPGSYRVWVDGAG